MAVLCSDGTWMEHRQTLTPDDLPFGTELHGVTPLAIYAAAYRKCEERIWISSVAGFALLSWYEEINVQTV